jgi:hypothetical protein
MFGVRIYVCQACCYLRRYSLWFVIFIIIILHLVSLIVTLGLFPLYTLVRSPVASLATLLDELLPDHRRRHHLVQPKAASLLESLAQAGNQK